MGLLSEEVRVALYARMFALNVAATYHGEAPPDAAYPFVIFNRIASGNVHYSLGNTRQGEDDLWVIKSICDESSSSTVSAISTNETILDAIDVELNSLTLALATGTVRYCRRINDIPEIKEQIGDRTVLQSGFILRVFAV